jgi:hypothetical protein
MSCGGTSTLVTTSERPDLSRASIGRSDDGVETRRIWRRADARSGPATRLDAGP